LQQLQAALRENRFEIHTQPVLATTGRVGGGRRSRFCCA
jgi:hypothetical protein